MEHQGNQGSTVFLQKFLAEPKNREAFGMFAAKYQPRIKSCCQRWGLKDANDADDLTANILLKLFERDLFVDFVLKTKAQFYGYLDTVTKHATLTFLRDRHRKPDAWSVGNADAQESLGQVTKKMVDDLELLWEEKIVLLRMIRARVEEPLGEKTRQVFRMLADEGRTVKEVAQHFLMTEVAVWQVRSRVLKKLREEFKFLGENPGEKE